MARLVRVARYLLPVRGAAPAWFGLHVYVDTATRRDRVVLTHGSGGPDALVRIQREELLDRFAVRTPRFRARWDEAVTRIVVHGRGIVVFAAGDEDVGDVVPPLVRTHLGARRGLALVLGADEGDDAALLASVLGSA